MTVHIRISVWVHAYINMVTWSDVFRVVLLDWKSSKYWYIADELLSFARLIFYLILQNEWTRLYLTWMWESQNFIMHCSSPEDVPHYIKYAKSDYASKAGNQDRGKLSEVIDR